MYALKRKNFMYVCWSNSANRVSYHQLTLLSTIDFLHFQLTSCLTEKVNDILEENQTYDPSINFGKGRAMQKLLHYATCNGLQSISILFDSIPVLPLSNASRASIQNLLKNHQEDAIQINMLITFNHLVSIHKKKGLELNVRDLLIFFNLIQTQSSLSKSENWFPICLPGISGHQMVFCYLNFLNQNLVHIMIADQSSIFPLLSQFNKTIKEKLINSGAIQKIKSGVHRDFIQDPSLQRMNLAKHFVVTYQSPRQMIMSSGQYFGQQLTENRQGRNKISQDQFKIYLYIYCQLYQHFLQRKNTKKQSLHVQSFYMGECGPVKTRKERSTSQVSYSIQIPFERKDIQKKSKLEQQNKKMGSQIRGTYIPKQEYACQCDLQKQFLGGYYSEGTFTIFMIASAISELQDAKTIISSILRHVREQQSSIFMNKYS